MKPPFLHRLLLLAWPRSIRGRKGEELSAFWRLQASEPRYRGLGRIRLLVALTADAVGGGLRARWSAGAPDPAPVARDSRLRAALDELRRAFGTLRRAPGFTVVAVLTLSLGIGATTAVVAVVERVLLRPLEYQRPDRLVLLTRDDDRTSSVSWPDFRDWRESARGFDAMAAWTETSADFQEGDGAATRQGVRTTPELFDVLGVPPLLGRTFLADEARPGGPDAVIVSWGIWQDRLGGDPDILGRTVRMDGRPVPVVGVMPRGFAFPDPSTDFWLPLRGDQPLVDAGMPAGTRTLAFLDVIARLQDGTTPAAALSDLRTLAARWRIRTRSGLPTERWPRARRPRRLACAATDAPWSSSASRPSTTTAQPPS